MHRSAAAVREERVVFRRIALAEDAGIDFVTQMVFEELENAFGRVVRVETKRIGNALLDRLVAPLLVEDDFAAEEVVGVEIAEDDVAVGERRRIDAALFETHADARAGAVRSELDTLRNRVKADIGARAGTHRVDIDQRQLEHETRHVGLGLGGELAAGDETEVEGRSADIGANDIADTEFRTQIARTYHAADRAGNEGAGEFTGFRRDRAAMRGHDAQLELTAEILRAVGNLLELTARRFCRIGLDGHGVQPGEILHDGIKLGRKIHGNALALAFHHPQRCLLDRIFMRAVDIGEQQVDDDALDIHVEQLGDGSFGFVFVKWNGFRAEKIDAAADTLHTLARNQRLVMAMGGDLEAVLIGIAEIGLNAALELEVIFHARRHDDAEPAALALQQTVEHRSAGIDAGRHFRKHRFRGLAPLRQRILYRAAEADRFIGRRRLRFANDKAPRIVDEKRIRHGATGIHGHDVLIHC